MIFRVQLEDKVIKFWKGMSCLECPVVSLIIWNKVFGS